MHVMAHSTPQRVLVAGAGALGCVFGGFLARAGLRVTLLGRPWMMDAVRDRGLTITGLWGEHHVHNLECATDPKKLEGSFDWVLLCVKSWATDTAARETIPLLADEGVMVSVQNGVGNLEAIAQVAGENRTGGMRVIFGAAVPEPGHATVTVYADPVLVGSPWANAYGGLERTLRELVGWLSQTPIPTVWTDTLPSALWEKVLYNSALNPLGALLGVPYGELADSPHTRALMDRIIEEAFGVAESLGVPLPWDTPQAYQEHFYARLVPPTAAHRSSMLQDLERGRPTEVAAINGQVVRHGAELGVPTPVNEALVRMIRFREARDAATYGSGSRSR